jgi:predicted metal-dependent HD superfamily phosphohydrolase
MINYQELSKKVPEYIDDFFKHRVTVNLPYHNKDHTEKVVTAAKQIANHYQLNDHDFFVVITAAWFHDTGYHLENGKDHEIKGAAFAAGFLKENGIEESTINEIKNCIIATQIPQHPQTLNEQIVCDADLYHLGTDDFAGTDKLMRKEYELKTHKKADKKEWRNGTIHFLQSHHYHTDYAQLLLNEKKQENIDSLLKKQKEISPYSTIETGSNENKKNTEKKEADKEKKVEKPVRGIETMFRVASTNHQRLSDMADSKAHIMISVNSIIISVVLSLLVRRLETAPNLIAPTLILLAGTAVAVIFSVLATRPKIPNGYFSDEQLKSRKINLLFFGNFYKMDFDHYYEGMKQVMSDSEFLYASLIRDIHSQGIVLGNKYKLLRASYTIFMFTLISSIIAFAIAIIFFP